jgi:hypothetical protein
MGYIGKNSELAWMQSLDSESLGPGRQNPTGKIPSLPSLRSIIPLSYFLDENFISTYQDDNPYVLPTRVWGDYLLEIYLQAVDPFFPLIERRLFSLQYEQVFSKDSSRPPKKWMAVLNIIFAIGTRYCQLSHFGPGTDVDDGSIFFYRAMALSSNDGAFCEYADIQQVQIESLASIYYLALAQVNR